MTMPEDEAELRAKSIAEAYTWIDTPFANGAKVKGEGVDCAMPLQWVQGPLVMITCRPEIT